MPHYTWSYCCAIVFHTHVLNLQSIAHVCAFTKPHTTHPVTPEQLLAGFSRSCLRRLNLDYVSLKIDTSSIFSDLILSRFSVWPTTPSEVNKLRMIEGIHIINLRKLQSIYLCHRQHDHHRPPPHMPSNPRPPSSVAW
ncbi:hypothetical protein HanPSC8_Chr04g0170871 [Helianthus annuus]|nr:hypothetical protein HanIR_Chr04g0190891 [Helianthus annuus]KAJ0758395.1 hypothetical protein HanLR1_Chr04g0149941 [Helianthus annuus]KAJ0932194.1 hypothetical protein HanPSC8_Chr04g0170871 [Helianthus annuus]